MATEITCILPDSSDPDNRIDRLGGPGWTKDEATLLGEVREGWAYFVQVDSARVAVVLAERSGTPYLRTDPEASAENHLLSLPPCA